MCGILDAKGNIPHSNSAFISDSVGSIMGGLLGTSALTTYVESAAAVREGGRTGVTVSVRILTLPLEQLEKGPDTDCRHSMQACVCAILFFLSVFFAPWAANIPSIATGARKACS